LSLGLSSSYAPPRNNEPMVWIKQPKRETVKLVVLVRIYSISPE